MECHLLILEQLVYRMVWVQNIFETMDDIYLDIIQQLEL